MKPRLFSKVLPSVSVSLACLVASGWLPPPAPLAFSAGLVVTAGLVLVICIVVPGPGRRPGRFHELGRGRHLVVLVALVIALARGLEPSGVITAMAGLGGAQCGLALAAVVVRILRTRPRADLVKRIGGRERNKRFRSFWFGRAPR